MSDAPQKLNRAERRLLRWIATFCASEGTEIGTVSPTVKRLERRGFIVRTGLLVTLADGGRAALLATGYRPTEDTDEDPPQ